MVKSVLGDETGFKSAEDRLFKTNLPTEVGLVIGKLNPNLDRGFIFDLIPTPSNDDGQPACSLSSIIKPEKNDNNNNNKKKLVRARSLPDPSSSFQSSLLLDTDWISEHARQVSQMLLGGIHVIGIYIWSPEFSFNSSTSALLQVIQTVASVTSMLECVVVHISFSPRKLTVRNCRVDSGNMRVCDFKLGRVLCSLRSFECCYKFEILLPIYKQGSFRDVIRNAILNHGKELKNAKALIDGDLVVDDQLLIPDGAKHTVELLLKLGNDCFGDVKEEIYGVVVFSGFVCSTAYVSPKESIQQALSDIREDILTSLQSRLNIICDDAEECMRSMDDDKEKENESEKENERFATELGLHSLKKVTSLPFPRRVLVPWKGDVFVCDYLQPSETFEVAKDHCKELLCMETPVHSSLILEPEKEAISLTVKTFWDAVVPKSSASEIDTKSVAVQEKDAVLQEGSRTAVTTPNFSTVIAFVVLLIAIVIGYFFYRK